jgi:hypothetical protein
MKEHEWNVPDHMRNDQSRYYNCYDVVDWEGENRPEVFCAVPKIDLTTAENRSDNIAAISGIVEMQIGCDVESFSYEER